MQTAEAALVVVQVGLGRWEAAEGASAAAVEARAAAMAAAEKARTLPPHCR